LLKPEACLPPRLLLLMLPGNLVCLPGIALW
jgi:hypothetical protein